MEKIRPCAGLDCCNFIDRQGTRVKFCSFLCRDSLARPKRLAKYSENILSKRPHKNCVRCGVDFVQLTKNGRFCSKRCCGRHEGLKNYHLNKELYLQRRRDYLKAGGNAKALETNAVYRATHREERLAYNKRYYAANRERYRNQKHVRRAREKSSPEENDRIINYMKEVRERRSNLCYYCQRRFQETPHFDHVVPLARGGKHEIANLCVSCPECNRCKSARPATSLPIPQLVFNV